MPELSCVDLSPSNWHVFTPSVVAGFILRTVRKNEDQGMCGGHYRVAVDMDMQVKFVFNEPKALLSYCDENVMQTVDPAIGDSCGICFDDLTNSNRTSPVNLPCSHAFHSQCITRWFFKGTACPLCRQELKGLVVAPWARTSIF
ncbi:hypothetical protein HU200_059905 [Digitaria exilis]|uniref:RING-type domain-containing protein n=1 Tax=Digitaria exilis TaxID=1010633 RepID=A0A835ADJ2_9POAL|nr:hypothetical protein HU200_059905 [Digitaria exilis]